MGPKPGVPGWQCGLGGLSLLGTQFNKSPGVCLGGSTVLVESRCVGERRLRPQAGCLIQLLQSSRWTPPRRFGCARRRS